MPLDPPELRDDGGRGASHLRDGHGGAAPDHARERRPERRVAPERQPAGPVAPERFGVLQALLAHLLAACGDERRTVLDADELAERFSIPREELQETLSLLNLVNFGGGCYTVYAEVDEETGRVRVDKELYGDVFRRAPKLTPLEARAIRLAIEYVGPTIAADAHTPLARVRRKLEETFGQFELAPATATVGETRRRSSAHSPTAPRSGGSSSSSTSRRARRRRPPVSSSRTRSSGSCPSGACTRGIGRVDGPRTYRLDRMRSATLTGERFESREGFDPNYLVRAATRSCSGIRRRSPAGSSSAARGR